MSARRTPSFRAYVMVDWSAASVPRTGRDSIWIAVAERNGAGARAARTALANIPTRAAAAAWLETRLAALALRGRVLAGFDFPFGYPAGMAARLGLDGAPWRALWSDLAARIADGDDNANNRFDVAEEFNRAMTGAAFPFWGNVREETRRCLVRRGRRPHGAGDLAERRLADGRVAGAHPVWQLAGNGAVGSQALLGIPRVWRLRNAGSLAAVSAIWPFETGLRDDPGKRVIFAEAYPSMVVPKRLADKPKDAGQVAAMVAWMAALDDTGKLAAALGGDPSLSAGERACVENEEAWIFGVTRRFGRGETVAPPRRRGTRA